MSVTDTLFAGSIPSLYDRYLGPTLFQPYAEEIAKRASELDPRRVLEIAAGTGIVTEALHRGLLEAEIVATDLNPAMLDIAAQRISSDRVTFQPADALNLPFEDGSFGLVVCQFGIMFFPDKVKGNVEARRVLRDGGTYLLAIWDTVERNEGSDVIGEAVAALFPDNPPRFIDRTPFGYADRAHIERDLCAAGFDKITIETIEKRCRAPSARDLAIGMCCGSPLRNEIEERDPAMLDRAVDAAAAALAPWEGPDGFDAPMSAHIVMATR
jgi:ubiquinone/menaquinone biosynthesis C-methylase UbiE